MKVNMQEFKNYPIIPKILYILSREGKVWGNKLKKDIHEDHVTISRYLSRLEKENMLVSERIGKTLVYRLNDGLDNETLQEINDLAVMGRKILGVDECKLSVLDRFKMEFSKKDYQKIYGFLKENSTKSYSALDIAEALDMKIKVVEAILEKSTEQPLFNFVFMIKPEIELIKRYKIKD